MFCDAVVSENSCEAVPSDHQLELRVYLDWRTLYDRNEMPSEVQQTQISAVIRSGEVSMTKQRNMRDATTREVQPCLKYHAVKAAIRPKFAATSVMKMRRDTALQGQRTSQRTTRDPWLP